MSPLRHARPPPAGPAGDGQGDGVLASAAVVAGLALLCLLLAGRGALPPAASEAAFARPAFARPAPAARDAAAAAARTAAAPWPTLQRADGSFRDALSRPLGGDNPRDPMGASLLGYGLLQTGVRDRDERLIGAGLRALAFAARRPSPGRRVVFENLGLAAGYNLARRELGGHRGFARVRPLIEARLRRVRVVLLGSARPFFNWYAIEALGLLELGRSGLRSGVPGSVLADRRASGRLTRRLLAALPRTGAGQARADAAAGGAVTVLSDPPANPPAYHALMLGLLARSLELSGDRAPARARALLPAAARGSWAQAGPDGDIAFSGRSQEQSWALAFTAYGAAAAAGRSPADADRMRALAGSALARLARSHLGGPHGLWLTPALRQDARAGLRGLDRYTTEVHYAGLTLIGLNWAAARAHGGAGPGPLASDAPGARVVGRGSSALALVRDGDNWFAVKQAPAARDPHGIDHANDLRYDGGLVALKRRDGQGGWGDVVPPRPRADGVFDSAGPVLLVGGSRARFEGERIRALPGGVVEVAGGYRSPGGAWVRRGVRVRHEPVGCGVRTVVPARRGDRLELSSFFPGAGPDAVRATPTAVTGAHQAISLSRPADVKVNGGYSSGADARLVRARMRLTATGPVALTTCAR